MTSDGGIAKHMALPSSTSEDTGIPDARRQSLRIAKDLYRLRRMRARAFGEHAAIFGEPAWDILLNLYIAQMSGRRISVRKAAMSGEVPQTTGLRILVQLEDRGLAFRVKDARDNRRSFVRLSETAVERLEACLPSIVDRTGVGGRLVKMRRAHLQGDSTPQALHRSGATYDPIPDPGAIDLEPD